MRTQKSLRNVFALDLHISRKVTLSLRDRSGNTAGARSEAFRFQGCACNVPKTDIKEMTKTFTCVLFQSLITTQYVLPFLGCFEAFLLHNKVILNWLQWYLFSAKRKNYFSNGFSYPEGRWYILKDLQMSRSL